MKKLDNIQSYIDSGILEQYVLGLTSEEQNREILYYAQHHPEIKLEIEQIEKVLESYAEMHAKPMPSSLKTKIISEIQNLQISKIRWRNIWINTVMAICAILIGVYGFQMKEKNQYLQSVILKAQAEVDSLKSKATQDSLSILDCNRQLQSIRSQGVQRINLKGTNKTPMAMAAIYYDTIGKRTWLDVVDLPETPKERQYQLWAIVAGKPVDLGVFDLDSTITLKEIQYVEEVQAFAITLEPRGGLPSPSMDMMIVIGNK